MISDAYGSMEAADEIELPDGLQQDEQPSDPLAGMQLWSYQHEDRINGVPVLEQDRGLKIDRESELLAMFELCRTPRSLLLYLSPETTDANATYVEVLARAAAGEVDIVDELRQWDAAGSRFVLWLRYDELAYRLHPRFSYIKE